MAAQLSWKRALEDGSPVMVNGSAGPTAELHQGDPFQQDLFQEEPPKELKEQEPAAAGAQLKEPAARVEDEEDEDEERPKTPEEEQLKPDALDDLYTSLASSADIYNSLSFTKPLQITVSAT